MEIFLETATRISTQTMEQHSGLLREALTSMYSLFDTTRQLLKSSQPSPPHHESSIEQLAIGMLNLELRPFPAPLACQAVPVGTGKPCERRDRMAEQY
jgi:hypothetical protein